MRPSKVLPNQRIILPVVCLFETFACLALEVMATQTATCKATHISHRKHSFYRFLIRVRRLLRAFSIVAYPVCI